MRAEDHADDREVAGEEAVEPHAAHVVHRDVELQVGLGK